jgi:hypothetical protein
LQLLLELSHDPFLRGVDLLIRQGSVGGPVGKRVSHTFLARWNVFAPEDVE